MRRLVTGPAAVLAAALVPALVVTGCSSSGGSRPEATASTSTSASASSSSAAPTSPAAQALAAKMRAGLAGLTSAHLAVDAGSLGGTSSGDFRFSNGTATASDVTSGTGSEKTEIITVGSTSYAKLPAGRNTSGKPWVKVSATSTNEFVRALTSTISLNQAIASLPAVAGIVERASAVTDKGQTALGHEYTLAISPAAAGTSSLGSLLGELGQASVPVELYLDSSNRPTNVRIKVAIGSQSFGFSVAVSKFNAPVTITAPPADQVSSA